MAASGAIRAVLIIVAWILIIVGGLVTSAFFKTEQCFGVGCGTPASLAGVVIAIIGIWLGFLPNPINRIKK